ncbi:MAG: acylneuraminate cytidylyltransferase family protein [Bacteriovoracaceae bacterium]|nr:acylneuraminate cytidylyltransferase family protein [Bacteriovoracaceae bacterium]
MEMIAVVPARSGSKGVPKKNIKELRGKPLMAYSILAGTKSKHISRTIVSTDSEEFAEIANSFGGETPFLRPADISGDRSTDLEMMIHVLDWLKENEGKEPDYIVHLRPTTPLRNVEEVDKAIEKFLENKESTALRSVHEMSESAYKTFEIDENNQMITAFSKEKDLDGANKARQGFPSTYFANGYVDVLSTKLIREKNRIHGDNVLPYVTEPVIEVDTQFDFELLEQMSEKNPNYYNNLFGDK